MSAQVEFWCVKEHDPDLQYTTSGEWTLYVQWVRTAGGGYYECCLTCKRAEFRYTSDDRSGAVEHAKAMLRGIF